MKEAEAPEWLVKLYQARLESGIELRVFKTLYTGDVDMCGKGLNDKQLRARSELARISREDHQPSLGQWWTNRSFPRCSTSYLGPQTLFMNY